MSSEDEYDIPSSPRQGSEPPLTSPPASPSRTGPASTPLGSPARHPSGEDRSPVLSLQEGRGRKRPAKDMTQFVDYAARNVKLKADRRASLLQFSKLGSPEQRITMAAHFFKFAERQEELQPAEVVFTLTDTAKRYIDRVSFLVSLSPSVPAYLESSGAFLLIMAKLERKYPSMKKDDPQYLATAARIKDKCTDVRYTIKKEIMASVGTVDPDNKTKQTNAKDIVTLCEDILDKTGLSPTIEMCGRVAFLRYVYAKGPAKDLKYWKVVDKQLDKIRNKHKDEKRKIHKVFKKILDEDEAKYGLASTPTSSLPAGEMDPMEVEDDV